MKFNTGSKQQQRKKSIHLSAGQTLEIKKIKGEGMEVLDKLELQLDKKIQTLDVQAWAMTCADQIKKELTFREQLRQVTQEAIAAVLYRRANPDRKSEKSQRKEQTASNDLLCQRLRFMTYI